MKKLLLIALVTVGLFATAAPKSEARVFINFGFGFPFYSYPAAYYPGYYGGCGYYPYRGGGYYGGGYRYSNPSYYSGRRVYFYSGRPFYWSHGHRVFLRHR
jgi:hypothetical protein